MVTMSIVQRHEPTNDVNEDNTGRHRPRERKENGEGFANICALTKIVICGTIFVYKHAHRAT